MRMRFFRTVIEPCWHITWIAREESGVQKIKVTVRNVSLLNNVPCFIFYFKKNKSNKQPVTDTCPLWQYGDSYSLSLNSAMRWFPVLSGSLLYYFSEKK